MSSGFFGSLQGNKRDGFVFLKFHEFGIKDLQTQ